MVSDTRRLEKIAEGREAEMFAWEDGKILRLFRGDFQRSTCEYQIRALQAVGEAGVRVPAIYGTTEVDGRLGVIMERIDGIDLLTLIGRKPWKVWWVGGIAGRTQAEINETRAPESLPSVHERYAGLIQRCADIPPECAAAGLAALRGLPEGDRLIHGDFHPGNIMMRDGRSVVLDWSNAMRGNPEADLARTTLMMQLGDPPPGTGAIIRVAATFARSILLGAHVRAYRRARRPDEALVRKWEIPTAVARLADGIASERPKLLKNIEMQLRAG